MATLLEQIGVFGDIFDFFLPFLLVFAITYGILTKTKALSASININAIISFTIALIVVLSGAGKFLMNLTPMLSVLFIIVFLMLMVFLFFGAKLEDVLKSKFVVGLIIIISLIFVFYVAGSLFGGSLYGSVTSTTGESTTVATAQRTCDFTKSLGGAGVACIFGHPKVLGALVLLGLLAVATFFILYVPKS